MSNEPLPRTLELRRGDSLLGTIEVKAGDEDFPWHSGAFRPAPGFDSVRELFADELRLIQENTRDEPAKWSDWEAVHDELHAPGLRLQSADRSYVAEEILIHIKGSEAWWRDDDEAANRPMN